MNNYLKGTIALATIFIVFILAAQNGPVKQTGTSSIQKFEYCRLFQEANWNSYTGGNTTTKCWVQFNYNGESFYKEDKTNIDKINSVMDGLNYLGSLGWDLTTSYTESGDGWRQQIHILKRKKQ
ncbi:hypothetical protein CAP36_05090 [Chitinophagaceae bacterium IBVUCB2]|nr:hypothetical protein CAP36_05090 [Chitinophagaceae bacterium IBVUCB2]